MFGPQPRHNLEATFQELGVSPEEGRGNCLVGILRTVDGGGVASDFVDRIVGGVRLEVFEELVVVEPLRGRLAETDAGTDVVRVAKGGRLVVARAKRGLGGIQTVGTDVGIARGGTDPQVAFELPNIKAGLERNGELAGEIPAEVGGRALLGVPALVAMRAGIERV